MVWRGRDAHSQEFWGRIHRSLALVPSLGHAQYFLSRITSTVLASLITSTPMIADRRLLDVYAFLREEHVFLRRDGEDEVRFERSPCGREQVAPPGATLAAAGCTVQAEAMYRVASLKEAEVLSRRRALTQLRDELNQRSARLLRGWLDEAASLPPPLL